MNVHTETPADPRLAIYRDMESPVCDLARLALALSIVAENVRERLRTSTELGRMGLDTLHMNEAELELLFALVDDAKDGAMALRQGYYGRAYA